MSNFNLFQPGDFPPIVTVPASHDLTTHHLFGQLPLVPDPTRLYPPQRRSPHPPSPLATGGAHSRSLSPTGNCNAFILPLVILSKRIV